MTQVEDLSQIKDLQQQIDGANLPADLEKKVTALVERLSVTIKFGQFSQEYQSVSSYIDWITHLPWEQYHDDQLDIEAARQVLDKHHYGLSDIKERILEFIAVMKLKKQQKETVRAPILCLVGLVGTGKTTLAKSIAQTLGRPLVRVPFGGIEESFYLRGRSRTAVQAEPGQIVKGLRQAQVLNPVILLDEIDRIAEDAKSGVMGVLVELLDPEQNDHFVDYFVDYPLDLSQAFFIATCNNTRGISQAVLDRLEVISMPSYSDEEKIIIGKKYLLPQVMADCGLEPANLKIAEEVWPKVVRPLGYDAGVRTLKRNIEKLCRQVAKKVVTGQGEQFVINNNNIKNYISTWS